MMLHELIQSVHDAVDRLDRYLADLPGDVSVDELVYALKQATGNEGLRTAVSSVVTALETHVADNLPADEWAVGDGDDRITAERKWSAGSTKWDTKACWQAVVEAAQEQGYDPLLVLPDAAAVSYYRVKSLKALGINPDAYRTQEGGRWRIVLS